MPMIIKSGVQVDDAFVLCCAQHCAPGNKLRRQHRGLPALCRITVKVSGRASCPVQPIAAALLAALPSAVQPSSRPRSGSCPLSRSCPVGVTPPWLHITAVKKLESTVDSARQSQPPKQGSWRARWSCFWTPIIGVRNDAYAISRNAGRSSPESRGPRSNSPRFGRIQAEFGRHVADTGRIRVYRGKGAPNLENLGPTRPM